MPLGSNVGANIKELRRANKTKPESQKRREDEILAISLEAARRNGNTNVKKKPVSEASEALPKSWEDDDFREPIDVVEPREPTTPHEVPLQGKMNDKPKATETPERKASRFRRVASTVASKLSDLKSRAGDVASDVKAASHKVTGPVSREIAGATNPETRGLIGYAQDKSTELKLATGRAVVGGIKRLGRHEYHAGGMSDIPQDLSDVELPHEEEPEKVSFLDKHWPAWHKPARPPKPVYPSAPAKPSRAPRPMAFSRATLPPAPRKPSKANAFMSHPVPAAARVHGRGIPTPVVPEPREPKGPYAGMVATHIAGGAHDTTAIGAAMHHGAPTELRAPNMDAWSASYGTEFKPATKPHRTSYIVDLVRKAQARNTKSTETKETSREVAKAKRKLGPKQQSFVGITTRQPKTRTVNRFDRFRKQAKSLVGPPKPIYKKAKIEMGTYAKDHPVEKPAKAVKPKKSDELTRLKSYKTGMARTAQERDVATARTQQAQASGQTSMFSSGHLTPSGKPSRGAKTRNLREFTMDVEHTGENTNKTIAQLQKEKAAAQRAGNTKRIRQKTFAINAKHHFENYVMEAEHNAYAQNMGRDDLVYALTGALAKASMGKSELDHSIYHWLSGEVKQFGQFDRMPLNNLKDNWDDYCLMMRGANRSHDRGLYTRNKHAVYESVKKIVKIVKRPHSITHTDGKTESRADKPLDRKE